jgi:hypothetical protein
MKKIMITLVLTCGIFTAASAAKNEKPWANGKLQVSANQRFLQFENGQPFFLLGDTGWLLPERLDRAEAQYYLQKCRVAGFNTVLIQVMDGTPSFNIYGQQSLPAGWDLSKADPAGVYSYWDHLDYIMELTPTFTDVIVKRYIRITGKTTVRCVRQGRELPREEIAAIFELDEEGGEQE